MKPSPPLPTPAQNLFALLRGETITTDDWDNIGVYALATGLGPLLLKNAEAQLPHLLLARLRLAAKRTEARNQALLAALTDLLQRCAAQTLPVIILKGAYLSPAIYRDLSLRGMSDIDIMVQPADLPRLQKILSEMGYEGKFTDAAAGPGVSKHEWTYQLAGTEATATNPYLTAESVFHIEPHTSLAETWFGLRVDITPGVWERAVIWTQDDAPALALDPIDCILHSAVHAIFHLIIGKSALIQLYDLRVLLQRNSVFSSEHENTLESTKNRVSGTYSNQLLERAKGSDSAPHLLAALRLSRDAYAAPVPDTWLDQLTALCPPSQRKQAETINLAEMWQRMQQAPLNTTRQRLARGISDRQLAARWAKNRRERWRVWRSALLFYRTDTFRIIRKT